MPQGAREAGLGRRSLRGGRVPFRSLKDEKRQTKDDSTAMGKSFPWRIFIQIDRRSSAFCTKMSGESAAQCVENTFRIAYSDTHTVAVRVSAEYQRSICLLGKLDRH